MAVADRTFASYEEFVERSAAWLAPPPGRGPAVVLDSRVRLVEDDNDVLRARAQGAFPLHWYWLDELSRGFAHEPPDDEAAPVGAGTDGPLG